jgi:hypothetical protein
MASVILYCRKCDSGYASVGDLPVHCPACGQETLWSTFPPHGNKVDGWNPTRDDLTFLKVLKIGPL